MKHKIDKEIDRILRKRFFLYDDVFLHNGLCGVFFYPRYSFLWKEYWKKINNRKHSYLCMYLGLRVNVPYYEEKSALLRLLIVEDFKKYCKKRLTK